MQELQGQTFPLPPNPMTENMRSGCVGGAHPRYAHLVQSKVEVVEVNLVNTVEGRSQKWIAIDFLADLLDSVFPESAVDFLFKLIPFLYCLDMV